MSLKKNAISGVFWTFTQQFGMQIISFFVSIVLARLLLPEEFGLIGMITVFMAVGQSLMDSGLTQSLIRTDKPDQSDYSTVFFFNLGGSIIVYGILFFAAPYIALFYNQEILKGILPIYCLSFIITAFSAVQLTRLTKKMDFKTQMIIAIPSVLISGLLGVYLAYQGYGVWALVWMNLSQSSLNTIQLWLKTKWRPSFVFNIQKFKYHFHFGYKLTLSGLLDTVFRNIYQIIIGKFFLASQVGFYTRADSLKNLPVTNISNALNKVTYPLFARIQNDDLRLKNAYRQIMQMVIFIIAPVLVFLGVLAEPLVRFLFTEKWLPAVPYFQVLCLTGILYPIHAYNLNVLKVKGRSDLFLRLEIIKKILVVLTVAVSIQFGIMGLIWGQVFTSILSFFINTYYTGKFLDYTAWQQAKDILPTLFITFAIGLIIFFIDQFLEKLEYIDILRLIISGCIGFFMYIGLAFLLKMEGFKTISRIILKK